MPPRNPPRNPPNNFSPPPDPASGRARPASGAPSGAGGAARSETRPLQGDRKSQIYARVVVALDGSAVSAAAIPPAVGLAEGFRGDLYLLRVVKPGLKGGEKEIGDAKSREAEEAHRYLEDMENEWFTPAVRFHRVVRVGDPVGEILGVADDVKADVIVMASHGRTGLSKLIVGSVAEGVLHKSTRPVMIIRGA